MLPRPNIAVILTWFDQGTLRVGALTGIRWYLDPDLLRIHHKELMTYHVLDPEA
jgi:hypothetical protein